MAGTDAPSAASPRLRTSPARVTVLVLSLVQAVSPALFALTGSTALNADLPGEPAIVPAGYAFSVWGVVCVAAVVYGVWQLPRDRGSDAVKDALAAPLSVAFAGFVVWLAAAASPVSVLTLPLFAAMLVALVLALRRLDRARRDGALTRWGRALTSVTVGVYAGWASAAVWVNLATVLAAAGLRPGDPVAWFGQAAILAGATATLCVIAWFTGADPAYVVAGVWALVGVIVGALGAQAPGLALVAAAGTVVFAVLAVLVHSRRGRRERTGRGT